MSTPITPHLWFDRQARDAADFYCSVFPEAAIIHLGQVRDTPSGDCDIVSFQLGGQPFMAISAGPLFTFNPAVSFVVSFDPSRDPQARERLDALWEALAEGGKILMPLDQTPFSERVGWVQDRYGVSWQLILSDPAADPRPFITPALLFTGDVYGKAEEASAFYTRLFKPSQMGRLVRWPSGAAPERENTVMFSDFCIRGTWFSAMDSAQEHGVAFNEAISFMVRCADQAEIDHYWSELSAVPQAEQCGWCKDRFGVSWQIVPESLDEMMRCGDAAKIHRVTQAFLKMKKFDVETLEAAFANA